MIKTNELLTAVILVVLTGCGEIVSPPTVVSETETFIGRQETTLDCSYTGICLKFDPFKMDVTFGPSTSCPGKYRAHVDIYETRKVMSDDTVRVSEREDNITLTSRCS